MKKNYGVSYTLNGKRRIDNHKRFTKQGARDYVGLMHRAQVFRKTFRKYKNLKVIKVK